MSFDTTKRLIELSDGNACEADVYGIVERVKEYDPNLTIQYCSGRPSLTEAPYRLVELCPDGITRVVMDIWDLDQRVLERLYAADTKRHDILARLDANNAAAREREQRRYREEVLGEAMDQTLHVLASPKGSYSVPGPVDGLQTVFDSHQPSKIVDPKTGREFRRATQ